MEEIVQKGRYKGGRPKCEFRTVSKSNYDRFCLENTKIQITYKQYEQGIREINLQYVLYCLETGGLVSLPFGMGGLTVHKHRGQKIFRDKNGTHHPLPVNWKATLQEGKKIYFFNEHTDGYHFRWLWVKPIARFKLTTIWGFKICKKYSKLLSDYCFNEEKQYYLKYREYDLKKRKINNS